MTPENVRTFVPIIEQDATTGLYVGHVPDLAGAHSHGETLDELMHNLREVIEMLVEDSPDFGDFSLAG